MGWTIVWCILVHLDKSCIMSIQCINEISRPGDLFKRVNPWIWVHISVLLFRPSGWRWHSTSLHLPLEHCFWILAKSIKDASPSAISICIFKTSEAGASMFCWLFHLLLFFRDFLPFSGYIFWVLMVFLLTCMNIYYEYSYFYCHICFKPFPTWSSPVDYVFEYYR